VITKDSILKSLDITDKAELIAGPTICTRFFSWEARQEGFWQERWRMFGRPATVDRDDPVLTRSFLADLFRQPHAGSCAFSVSDRYGHWR